MNSDFKADSRIPQIHIIQCSVIAMNKPGRTERKLSVSQRKLSISQHCEFSDAIVYDEDSELVKAGTVAALVEHLTRHDKLDAAFNRTFLTTYKYFLTTTELVNLLIDRFECTPPVIFNPVQIAEWSSRIKPLVRIRVLNVFRQWLESFWIEPIGSDATTTQELLKIKSFVYRITDASEAAAARQLLSIIQCRLEGVVDIKTFQASLSNAPKPILPRKLNKIQFMKVDAKELARQLTILEASMFRKIQPAELLNKAWQKKNVVSVPGPAPNVRASIRFSNQLSNWVVALVLAESDLKKRTQVIGHLINVASVSQSPVSCSTIVQS
ncbi:hypothetical protein N7532_007284 [Penicillium argentinense]|uniref:N-terminal Ras-GEF domain-containing protein n=1 Tax=Penicillium argentinense TaxID=1131581 RepID=A0A9W9K6I6_9EURO|nr:uncharacterized protein N7532_007284 [Penicillium argentinense]KAJ5094993.1 hypothetical protein N7532_007284 [Penicillium argentinense]